MKDSNDVAWWLSSGPPQPSRPAVGESATANTSFVLTPEVVQTGLHIASGVADTFAKIFTQEPGQVIHDVRVCGVCPVCVGVNDIKKRDPELGGLIENALGGVTQSYEKLKERIPELLEPVTKLVVESLVQSFMKGRFS